MPTIRTGSIDAHAHWAPEPYVRYVTQLGGKAAGGPLSPLMSDLDARMQWMDSRGVQTHVLTLSGSMPWQWAPQDAANRLARIVNDAAIEAHQAYPDRFVAGAALPIRDPASALKELDRVALDILMELANLIVARAVSSLNDSEYAFRVTPPLIFTGTCRPCFSSRNTETLVVPIHTEVGDMNLSVALRMNAF